MNPYILYPTIGVITIFLLSGIRVVRPTHRALLETLGKYRRTLEPGFTWIVPLIQRTIYVNITETMMDVEPQMVITSDNLNALVDAVVYYKVKDVKAAIYNVDDHQIQLTSLARTTLRSVIGKLSLSHANENRQDINSAVETVLDKETDSYGVDVLRVEIQKIEPPKDVQTAMNEVVKAERKKMSSKDYANAAEIEADGLSRARIKKAEGDKQASILKAQGQSKAFDLINKSFVENAQVLRRLEVTENSLKDNAKIVLTEKGISPSIIMDAIPVSGGKKYD